MGKKWIDVEMARAEITNLNQVLTSLTDEREKLKVELNSQSRITVRQMAEPSDIEAGVAIRYAIAGISGVGGFFLPVIGMVLWDIRSSASTRCRRFPKASDCRSSARCRRFLPRCCDDWAARPSEVRLGDCG